MKLFVTLLSYTILLSNASWGQQYTLKLHDIALGTSSSGPTDIHNYQGQRVYFYADNDIHGRELWYLDASGNSSPVMVADINPNGDATGYIDYFKKITSLGETIFFEGNDGVHGRELWSTSNSGSPQMLTDIYSGSKSSYPLFITEHQKRIFTAAGDSLFGSELQMHTVATGVTRRLSDFVAGSKSGSNVRHMTGLEDKVYFSAYTPQLGQELYSYDIPNDTILLVADIDTMPARGSNPNNLITFNNKIYFFAGYSNVGQLFELDKNGNLSQLTNFVYNGVWGSGPEAGWSQLIGYKNALYFSAKEEQQSYYQLYKHDLATHKTYEVMTINPDWNASPSDFAIYNDRLFFAASDGKNGRELWAYNDITPPVMVADIAPTSSSAPRYMTVCGNYLYFAADEHKGNGYELYEYSDNYTPPTNINETNAKLPVTIYPNPTKGIAHLQFTLNTAQTLNISLTDMNGRVVYNSNNVLYSATAHTIDIPLSNLPRGSYIYQLTDNIGNTYATGKLQKQ